MNYKITNDMEKATHWIPFNDKNNNECSVTVGKIYELIWDDKDKEFCIVNDEGILSHTFPTNKGHFIYFDDYEQKTSEEKKVIEQALKENKRYKFDEVFRDDELPSLDLKMEPQELDYNIVNQYIPKNLEIQRRGKLLYQDEELINVLKLIMYNLGVKKSLDTIPVKLIQQYSNNKCLEKIAHPLGESYKFWNREEDSIYDDYSKRFVKLIIKQRNFGLTEEESLELKEKCKKTIGKIDWQLKD